MENHFLKIPPGTQIYRVVEKAGRPAGEWWSDTLPENGKEWREGLAVLDSFNTNGYFVEMTVPKEGLRAWEGKAAGQVENSLKAKNTQGQFLQGGRTQLFIDMGFPANQEALRRMAEELDRPLDGLLVRKSTDWTDHKGLNVPQKVSQGIFLGPGEILEKSTRPKRRDEDEEETKREYRDPKYAE